jgi:hypothetical protein
MQTKVENLPIFSCSVAVALTQAGLKQKMAIVL